MNQIAKLLAIVVLIFLAGYLLEEAIDISGENISEPHEHTLELISELFSVFVAFSIFSVTWHSYDKSRDNRSLFLGATFFLVGILILFHLLSYPFMPEFLNPNSEHKAALFLLESRFILAVMLLASVYIHKDTLPSFINKYVIIAFLIVMTSIFIITAILYNNSAFEAYHFESLSAETIFLLSIITAAISYASYKYFKKFRETGQINLVYLIYGCVVIIFSNIVYFSYEFSAHFLIITGFYFIYLALYKSSVEQPYEKLAIAEGKLRNAAEEKYRNLFNNANDAIIIHDLECRITSWNHAAEKIFGWTSKEIMGKQLLPIIVPEESQAQMQSIACSITRGENSYFEPELIRRDGSRINASLTVSNLKDADQNVIGISCIIRDITERKRVEKELKLRGRIIETLAEGVYLVRASDGVIVYANPKFERMFGYDKGELVGKHVSIVNAPTEKKPQEVVAEITHILKETGEWRGEVHNIRKDRTRFWCYATVSTFEHPEHGNVWISVHTDISELKRAEDLLRLSEGRLVTFMDSATDAFTIWDSKLNLVELNIAASRYLPRGVEKKDVVGKNLQVLEPDAKPSGRFDQYLNVIKTGEPLSQERLALQLNFDNVVADRYLNVRAFKAGDGIGLMTTDITEMKRMQEIQLENERLMLAGKAKSEFLAIMSHELRTPLNAVIGFSELMKRDALGKLNEKQKRYIENILTGGKNLLSLVESILDMSRVEAGKMELFIEKMSVPATINDTLTLFKEKAVKQNISIKTDLDAQLDIIETDTLKFKNILFNLLDNAIKFSLPEGGTVTIRTKKEGDMAMFSVADTGIGIKEEDLGRLFRTFEQLDSGITRKYGGTGLGLAVSKKLVELLGGSITAESRYGEGSTFTFTLPIASNRPKTS